MPSTTETFVIAVGSSSVTAAGVTGVLEMLRERRGIRWEAKRAACVSALAIVDAVWANQKWTEGTWPVTPQERPSMARIREVHNQLIVTCKHRDVVREYQKCLHLTSPSSDTGPSAIGALRNAIRSELGFKGERTESEKQMWIAAITATEEHVGDS